MPAAVVSIAEAVKEELNAASFSQTFTAERTYLPAFSLDDLESVKVAVVGSDAAEQTLTRASVDGTYEVQVGLAKRAEDTAAADEMLLLVQEVGDHFRSTLGRDLAGAKLMAVTMVPLYDLQRLREAGIFYAVLMLRFAKER